MRHIKKFENYVNEGIIGTSLLVLTGIGVTYVISKIRKFLSKYGKFLPTMKLSLFLNRIERIEKGETNGEVVIKENPSRVFSIIVYENGEEFDSITIDRYNDIVYDKKDSKGNVIIPIEFSKSNSNYKSLFGFETNDEQVEKVLRETEKELVESLVEVIKKYSVRK